MSNCHSANWRVSLTSSDLLEYIVVWDGCSDYNTNTLEKIQHEGARIVTALTRSVSIEKLFTECGWTTLTNRRIQQKNDIYV